MASANPSRSDRIISALDKPMRILAIISTMLLASLGAAVTGLLLGAFLAGTLTLHIG
jgi:hypothetical protein